MHKLLPRRIIDYWYVPPNNCHLENCTRIMDPPGKYLLPTKTIASQAISLLNYSDDNQKKVFHYNSLRYNVSYYIIVHFIMFHYNSLQSQIFLYSFCAIPSSPNKSTGGQLCSYKVTLANGSPKLRSSKSILLGPNQRYVQIDWRLNMFTVYFVIILAWFV